MNKTKTFVAAVAVPVALLAMAAQSASAATAPTTTVPGATVPAGYVRLVDDTNRITVTVPNTWSTVQTVPGQSPTGSDVASILATAGTDLDNFRQTFVDGVWYAAYPYSTDPSVLMGENKLPAGLCVDITESSDNVQSYTDGLFTGQIQVGTSCGGSGDTTWNLIVASPPDQSFTAVVEVQTTDPQALQTVHDSFNYLASAGPVGTTIPGAATTVAGGVATTAVTTPVITPPVQTTTAVTQPVASTVAPATPTTAGGGPTSSVALTDATLPLGPLQPTDVALRDDTDKIQIAVPAAWTAIDTAPFSAADGTTVPRIVATTDIAAFRDTFSVPGVVFGTPPFNPDPMAQLDAMGMGTSCTDAGIAPYNDAAFTGYFQTWTNCGGGATEIITIAANARDSSDTVTLLIQLPTPDATALQTVVSSFNFVGAGPAGTAAS